MTTPSYRLQIKEQHLDTFGHVNNAVYLTLYEEARWEIIQSRGFGLEKILSEKIGPVILEVNVKFKRELKLREWITIESSASPGPDERIMLMSQKMIKEDGKIASEAVFSIGMFDLKERKLIRPTPEWLKAVGFEN